MQTNMRKRRGSKRPTKNGSNLLIYKNDKYESSSDDENHIQEMPRAIYMQSQEATLKKKSMKEMKKIVKKNPWMTMKMMRIIQQ